VNTKTTENVILRSGVWGLGKQHMRSAARDWSSGLSNSGIGFRLVRSLNPR
jgi:hypothetical protein